MSADRPPERDEPATPRPLGHPTALPAGVEDRLAHDPVTGPAAAGGSSRTGWPLGDWSRQEAQVLRRRLMRIRR